MMQMPGAPSRVIHWFTFPESLRADAKVARVGLVELTVQEELRAAKLGENDGKHGHSVYAIQSSLRAVDTGVEIVPLDGDAKSEQAYASMKPRARVLVMQAFTKIHAVEAEVTKSFLDSHASEV